MKITCFYRGACGLSAIVSDRNVGRIFVALDDMFVPPGLHFQARPLILTSMYIGVGFGEGCVAF